MRVKVLIVAKTRQGSGACIGGITFEGQSVRLIAADAATNERAGLEYQVGGVWEIEATPPPQVTPPHVENVIVHAKRRLGNMANPIPFIEERMPPGVGGVERLYEGLTNVAPGGSLFIAQRTGVPPYSTTFWRPDQPLQRDEEGKRIRYRYPTPDGGRTLVFVGFQEPLAVIPAGALVRVSLAHWWRPRDAGDEVELRCYVQLSGWFLPKASSAVTARRETPAGRNATEEARAVAAPTPAAAAAPSEPPPQPSAAADLTAARRLLKTVFGYDAFRPFQEEIIAHILRRQDTLAVMPTGSGKSLCYQLPALLFDGLTVVVSPLISLMHDQVMQLRELGVPAAYLNSMLAYDEYVATADRVRQGQVKLLYTSPETLLRPETQVLLDRSRVACLAIDEAHCISAWGHDFRPEYRQLLPVRQRYGHAVCVAFTATATPRVRADICAILGFREHSVFVASFNRENLFLEVQPRTNGLAQTLAFLAAHRDQSGIIYCSTRDGVDRLTAQLIAHGWPALPYHAGLDDDVRRRHQDAFARDKAPIIVATIAFGMGINKSNVRFILHYNLPASLENYYQEIGRAGRDGLRADCLLLFSRADMQTIYGFIEEGAPGERPGRHARLQAMVRYAETDVCRRLPILEYFGETASAAHCGFCDNCLAARGEREMMDATLPAQKFLSCVVRTGEMFGAGHIINVLRGSRSQEVLRRHHDRLSTYGIGAEYSAAQWRYFAEQFIRQGLLVQDMAHGGLSLTDRGRAVLRGATVSVPAPPRQPLAAPAEMSYDVGLFEKLRALRRRLAEAADLPPYMIFSDRTLTELATYLPHSMASLSVIHGIGERKAAQYGEAILAVIRAHCTEHGLSERPRPVGGCAPEAGKRRWEEVGELFAAGRTVEEIAALFAIKPATVITHLCSWLASGQPVDTRRIRPISTLSAEDQARVLAAMAELGPERLRPLFDAFEERISYDELHIMRLCYLAGDRAEGSFSSTKK